MITIALLPLDRVVNIRPDYIGIKVPKNEIAFLCDIDDKNLSIYVMPHERSVLREYFIGPFIQANGDIDNACLNKELFTEVNGISFKYKITKL